MFGPVRGNIVLYDERRGGQTCVVFVPGELTNLRAAGKNAQSAQSRREFRELRALGYTHVLVEPYLNHRTQCGRDKQSAFAIPNKVEPVSVLGWPVISSPDHRVMAWLHENFP
jgi:hypothetical protein